jgi:hypothetical protein
MFGTTTFQAAISILKGVAGITAAAALAAAALMIVRHLLSPRDRIADTSELWTGGIRIVVIVLVISVLTYYGASQSYYKTTGDLGTSTGDPATSLLPDSKLFPHDLAIPGKAADKQP